MKALRDAHSPRRAFVLSEPAAVEEVDTMLTGDKRVGTAFLSVLSNTVLILLKVTVGLLIGSVAVISEAIHSAVDLIAALIALFAVRVSRQEADDSHPFGHGKYENLSGTIEAVLIFGAAAWIIYEAVCKLISPEPMEAPVWGVAVMMVSALVNIFVSRRLFKVGKETDSIALQADAWHLRTDVYTSLGVMVGLLAIWIIRLINPGLDVHWLDPAVAIFVALLILRTAWDLTREAARDLLDVSLPSEDVDWIKGFVLATWPQVRSFHNLRTRKAGPNRFIDFHVAVDSGMTVGEAHALGDEIVHAIKERFALSRVNIHVEPCDHSCTTSCETGCSFDVSMRRRASKQTV
jgi:cation diffusion facilitator family transporter